MKQLLLIFISLFCISTAKGQEPAITMTAAAGSEITLIIRAKVSNTIVKIDYGDGNLVENTVALTYGYSSNIVGTVKSKLPIKIYGSEITILGCHSNEITTLDISKCPSLIQLGCSSNQIKQLDVSKNLMLEVLDCRSNQLTSLDLSNLTVLKRIECDDNNISTFTVNNNPALTLIGCTSNQLTFATLPLQQSTWTTYNCRSQDEMIIPKTINIETAIDLSTQYSIHENFTNYVWYKKTGPKLVENVDYS